MADIRGVTGTQRGSYLTGGIVEVVTVPAGTNPTVTFDSPYIRSTNDIYHFAAQGDPGAAIGFGFVVNSTGKDQAPGKTTIPGNATLKVYGTLAASLKVAVLINTTLLEKRPVFQPFH